MLLEFDGALRGGRDGVGDVGAASLAHAAAGDGGGGWHGGGWWGGHVCEVGEEEGGEQRGYAVLGSRGSSPRGDSLLHTMRNVLKVLLVVRQETMRAWHRM